MKKTKLALAITLCFSLGVMQHAFAAGFKLNEHDAKASGMMNAFTALADNPSALHYNPAGIVQLDGINAQAGFGYFIPSASFKSAGTSAFGTDGETTDVQTDNFLVPYLYFTYKLNDQWSFGFSETTPFGLGTEWPGDWEGRYITGGQKAEVKTINLQGTIAYKPLENVSIAFSPQYQYFDVELMNKLPDGVPNPSPPPAVLFLNNGEDLGVRLIGDNWQFGWNLSTMIWATENIRIGALYQASMEHEVSGTLTISGIDGSLHPLVGEYDAKAKVELPASFSLGVAWLDEQYGVELDVIWEGWSSYDKLAVDSDEFKTASGGQEVSVEKNWDDVFSYRIGGFYKLTPVYELRAGLSYVPTPVPTETLDVLMPTQDRWYFAFGGGAQFDQFSVNASAMYLTDSVDEFDNDVGNYGVELGNPALGNMTGNFESVGVFIFNLDVAYRF